ncbi:hypothetical protein [Chromobacterium sp. CV08]|uniref:hypothetical protein n=1 Tax=Chromobacterium sp. CV08 TaxID=3133274 RepID=UPI003DA8D02F
MSIIARCTYPNPINNGALPPVPRPQDAPSLAPAQGDHVFGDVIGVIDNALAAVFGGGAVWRQRMRAYSVPLDEAWAGLAQLDLGHSGANQPLVARRGAAERDRHAHMFGGYSGRLQWQWCEIICAGFPAGGGGEDRRIGGRTKAWRSEVLKALDDVLDNLVDDTALRAYIANPGQERQANPATVFHDALSLARAQAVTAGLNGPGKARIEQVLRNYDSLRNAVLGLLDRFDTETRTFDPTTGRWS